MGLFDRFKNNRIITPVERRNNTIEQLKKSGIAYNPHLPLLEPDESVTLKSTEEIAKRCLGSMMCIQLACSIRNGENYGEALAFVTQQLDQWHISTDDLLPKEKVLIYNRHTTPDSTDELITQNIIDIIWTYETYWSLAWALDLVSDKELKNASKLCNTEKAMILSGLIADSSVKPRSVGKILDMLDLFYCYHWACVEKRLRPATAIGNLNPEVVYERRRGLEWLISEEKDWNQISLDT
ncbi:MAG: DUF4272 domain-containing protein [Eubacterium sp.]|nr:DUF4272 domain-containing protein [Eubacterium sp.]MCM1214589.1 DUF4272 domain-containing protein [Lachnospiraceae bacterium]MCM1215665.1 DUF4272 domain-containing protein [Lachnospiraceae bacterium]MCM1238466.1 DUF4272 domain-containing protein [Lachnospiraceae bacterium]MCM1409381.1 DUF4272 domain-containing protein [Lachnospiraceae bacterium]